MDRDDIMKKIGQILDFYGVNHDREAMLDDLYEVVEDAYFNGYCEGQDNPWRNDRKPIC